MLTVRVPERVRNKCERVTGPQPERFRSVFAGVNATRTSGTGPERDRNGTGTRTGTGPGVNTAFLVMWFWGSLPDFMTLTLLTQLPSSEQLRRRNANKNIVIYCN